MRSAVPTLFMVMAAVFAAGCDDPAAPGESGQFRIRPDSAVIVSGDSMRFDVGWSLGTWAELKVLHFYPVDGFGARDYPEMVGRNGWVRGLQAGTGHLIASLGALGDTAFIRVVPGPAATAAIDWIGPRLWTRHRYEFPAVVRDRIGNRTEGETVWSSRTPERLTFAEDGTALALDSGSASFTVALAEGQPLDTGSVLIVPFSGEWREFGLADGSVWCALDTGGRISCDGYNDAGELGYVSPTHRIGGGGQYVKRRRASFGYPVDSDHLFASVEKGYDHVCALGQDGLAYCWGGRSGIGNQEGVEGCSTGPTRYCRFEPMPVSPDLVFLDITPRCGVTRGGDVWCWEEAPELVFSDTPLRTLEGGRTEGCGLSREGAAYCWGSNSHGQLGTGTVDTLSHPEPVPVDTDLRFTELGRREDHACGLTSDGDIWCWGLGAFGQLGTDEPLEACPPRESGGEPLPCAPSPVRVASSVAFSALSVGGQHTCGLSGDGTVYCWGANHHRQVAPDASIPDDCLDVACSRLPRALSLDAPATSVTAGILSTCAGMVGGSFRCWGVLHEHRFDPIGPAESS